MSIYHVLFAISAVSMALAIALLINVIQNAHAE